MWLNIRVDTFIVKYQMSEVLIYFFLLSFHKIPENQNYLNYQQQQQQQPQQQPQPQGRFLSSFPQQSRNGFFPVQRNQQQQSNQAGSYHSQDLYLDGPSTPPFFPFQQSFAVSHAALESKSYKLIDLSERQTHNKRHERMKVTLS